MTTATRGKKASAVFLMTRLEMRVHHTRQKEEEGMRSCEAMLADFDHFRCLAGYHH